jgi:hypothetical protein
MRTIDLLDRPIAFHRCLAELAGSVNAGLMLSQALYWAKRTKAADGWFWKTAEEWQEETYLTRTEQATARKQLKRLSCWQEELRGVPAKLFYRVDLDELDRLLFENKDAGNVQSSLHESMNPVCRIPENKTTGILQTITETTTETTTEITSEREHTPQTDVWTIALEHLPTLGIWQQDVIEAAGITKLHLWRQTCHNWATNRYSARNITGLIDSYYRLEKQDAREREYQNGQNGRNGSNRRETHNQRAARQTFELIASLRGEDGGGNSSDSADAVFELPASFR